MIICITGIDGCGKTTQINLLNNFLLGRGHSTFISKAYGQDEKEIFSDYIERIDPVSLLFIFQALHNEQYLKMEQAEAEGKIVLADRWDESYLAYHSQFGVLSSNEELRSKLYSLVFHDRKPEITCLLKLEVSQAKARRSGEKMDFFDRLPADYHQKMADSYQKQGLSDNWLILDATLDQTAIHEKIVRSLDCFVH